MSNPSPRSNGKPIVKEEARSNTLNLNDQFMLGSRNLKQPFNSNPTLNDTIPAGSRTEGHYQTIDEAFSPSSEHDVDSAFVTDHHEYDRIRQRASQRDELEQHCMDDELMRLSQFSDSSDRDRYNAYLRSESDRIALISREHHLEKLRRQCQASWYGKELNVERSNSVQGRTLQFSEVQEEWIIIRG